MRLANRFRPQKVVNKLTKRNVRKQHKRIAANHAILVALAAEDKSSK
ncbi:MAG: hypothetical protein SOT81_05385 [Treponema sp.]|nr:hypothetical protein [Treponema sp.]